MCYRVRGPERSTDRPRTRGGSGRKMKSLQVRIYETLAEIESLRPCWDQLLCEFRGATTFSSWEWLAPWWRAFGQRRLLLVLAFLDESSQLVGLAPREAELHFGVAPPFKPEKPKKAVNRFGEST